MGSLNIYGALAVGADPRVQTEGDLACTWSAPRLGMGVDVRCSTGDTVRVFMTPGAVWSAQHIVQPTGSTLALVAATHADAHDGDQTAALTTPGSIDWVEVITLDGAAVPPGRISAAGVPARADEDNDPDLADMAPEPDASADPEVTG